MCTAEAENALNYSWIGTILTRRAWAQLHTHTHTPMQALFLAYTRPSKHHSLTKHLGRNSVASANTARVCVWFSPDKLPYIYKEECAHICASYTACLIIHSARRFIFNLWERSACGQECRKPRGSSVNHLLLEEDEIEKERSCRNRVAEVCPLQLKVHVFILGKPENRFLMLWVLWVFTVRDEIVFWKSWFGMPCAW